MRNAKGDVCKVSFSPKEWWSDKVDWFLELNLLIPCVRNANGDVCKVSLSPKECWSDKVDWFLE